MQLRAFQSLNKKVHDRSSWMKKISLFQERPRSWSDIQIIKLCHFRAECYLRVDLVRTPEFTGKEMEALEQMIAQDPCFIVWSWDHLDVLPLLVKYFQLLMENTLAMSIYQSLLQYSLKVFHGRLLQERVSEKEDYQVDIIQDVLFSISPIFGNLDYVLTY